MRLTGQRNQCPTCGQYFNRNLAFERHRVGPFGDGPNGTSPNRRCLTPDEMRADAHFNCPEDGFWRFSKSLTPPPWRRGP